MTRISLLHKFDHVYAQVYNKKTLIFVSFKDKSRKPTRFQQHCITPREAMAMSGELNMILKKLREGGEA